MTLPTPRITDPASVPALRWGMVGIGWISTRFAAALHGHTPQRLAAVAGRDQVRTDAFAASHGIPTAYASVEALMADPRVDVVYVATPHSGHREVALAAIAAGKHVLVEKPMALNAREAQEIADAARAAGVLAMEAMWTRYLPQMDILRQLLADGAIGQVHQVDAGFGFPPPFDPAGRYWNLALGGGALLDLGVYPISFASSVLGTPASIVATGIKTPDDVDMRANAILTSANGASANVSTTMVSLNPVHATVMGETGLIDFVPPFFSPRGVSLTRVVDGAPVSATWTDDRFDEPYHALSYQCTALAKYVAEGRLESPLHPLAEVVAVQHTIDVIREQLTVTDWLPGRPL